MEQKLKPPKCVSLHLAEIGSCQQDGKGSRVSGASAQAGGPGSTHGEGTLRPAAAKVVPKERIQSELKEKRNYSPVPHSSPVRS